MQDAPEETHPSVKSSSNKKTAKTTQGSKPPEGFILTNTALNSYVYEYLKPLTEETYALLEETRKIKEFTVKGIKNRKIENPLEDKSLLSNLIGSMVDTVDPETIEVKEEEKRSRRITSKHETANDLTAEIGSILQPLSEEDAQNRTGPDYAGILEKVQKINKNNRKKIATKRKMEISYLFYRSLLEKIDCNIEILFKKIKKKKKKEEDTNYYQELEDLLEKRSRFKILCKNIPDNLEEIEESSLGLESIGDLLNEKEKEIVQSLLPLAYIESWDE